jgi:FdhE protein
MIGNTVEIERATAQLAALRPAYASILGFYGPVFAAQLRAAADTSPVEIDIDPSLLELKSEEGFSLIDPAAFSIDFPAARKLLVQICRIAISSGDTLKDTGQALLKAVEDGRIADGCFNDALLMNHRLSHLADQLDVAVDMLSRLICLAAGPSVETNARRLAERLVHDGTGQGYCPICGSAPSIGELDSDGRQWLHCGLCWHRWPAMRLTCPFCGNRDSDSLAYMFSDEEPEYRVNVCGECRRYVKIVDIRKLNRCFHAPLEQVASLHLDMLAAENGYCRTGN